MRAIRFQRHPTRNVARNAIRNEPPIYREHANIADNICGTLHKSTGLTHNLFRTTLNEHGSNNLVHKLNWPHRINGKRGGDCRRVLRLYCYFLRVEFHWDERRLPFLSLEVADRTQNKIKVRRSVRRSSRGRLVLNYVSRFLAPLVYIAWWTFRIRYFLKHILSPKFEILPLSL